MSVHFHLHDLFRLTSLQRPRHPAALSAIGFVALGAALLLLEIGGQWLMAGEQTRFQLYGVNSALAGVSLSFATIALLTRNDAIARRNLALALAGVTALAVIYNILASRYAEAHRDLFGACFITLFLWNIAASWRAFQASETRRPLVLGVVATLGLWLGALALPNWPVFPSKDFSRATANIWEGMRAAADKQNAPSAQQVADWRKREQHVAQVEAAQPQRIEAALAAIAPRQSNKPNIFVIGVAGWADQDVFQRETDQSIDIIKSRLGLAPRFVTLVNNPAADDTRPIASIQNLAAVLRGVAARMDREKDALILTMTSHGSREGFALENGQLVDRTLSPQMLKDMLDAAGIKNRALIVSACHSGVFIKAFSDPASVVITAAAAEKSSFGCSNENKWTYFGEAFFDKGLRETGALEPAFEMAKALIAKREADHKFSPSEPQIYIGADFRRRFPALIGGAQAPKLREASR